MDNGIFELVETGMFGNAIVATELVSVILGLYLQI